jgi:hypothetical protein
VLNFIWGCLFNPARPAPRAGGTRLPVRAVLDAMATTT